MLVGRLVLPKLGSSFHVRRDVSRSTCSFPIQIPQRSLTELLSSSELRFHAFCDAFVALDALPRRPSASHVAQQHVEASLSFVFLWFRWAPGTDRRGFQSTVRFERKENRTSVRDKRGILPLRTWGQEPPREVLQGRRSWGVETLTGGGLDHWLEGCIQVQMPWCPRWKPAPWGMEHREGKIGGRSQLALQRFSSGARRTIESDVECGRE